MCEGMGLVFWKCYLMAELDVCEGHNICFVLIPLLFDEVCSLCISNLQFAVI